MSLTRRKLLIGAGAMSAAFSTSAWARDALDTLEGAFIGNYSRSEIDAVITPVMRMYKLPINEDNYHRAGSVLVVMRKDNGISEMRILSCMRTSGLHEYANLPEGAALCAVELSLK